MAQQIFDNKSPLAEHTQCWKFAPVRQSKADNFGGGPGTFCWIFFNSMFVIWDSRYEDIQLFDWVSNIEHTIIYVNISHISIIQLYITIYANIQSIYHEMITE